MKDVQRQTRSYLMALFQQHGFNPRSDLGQNFLIDVNLIEFVVRHAELGPRDVVLEVGTGTGGMTAFLASQAAHVIAVEIDRNMFALTTHAVQDFQNVTLINKDVLKNKNRFAPEVLDVIREQLAAVPNARLKLVANLPYSVATPVISNLVASDLPWQRMVATIQWELGEKMAAGCGDNGYGALSVWMQSQTSVRILRKLGPKVFWPRPRVDSAIVSIWRDDQLSDRIRSRPFFLDFLRRLFHHRRKLLRGVLARMYRRQLEKEEIDRLLTDLGYPQEKRAEKMEVAELIELSNKVFEVLTAKGQTPEQLEAQAAADIEADLNDDQSAQRPDDDDPAAAGSLTLSD